jgi:L-threonylcarbamoyladenylate synthase
VIPDLERYVKVLERGGVVACATETLMGLLADARRPEAVDRVVQLKGRAAHVPMAVLLPHANAWETVARDVPDIGRRWAALHWPGPLTMVTWAREGLPAPLVREGKVGARVPGPSPALHLVRAFDGPLTATSANPSGAQPAVDDAQVRAMFGDGLDAVVPGAAPDAPASTVVDLTSVPPRVLRAGAVIPDMAPR